MRYQKADSSETWDFACTASDPSDATKTSVVLREKNGSHIVVPLGEFQKNYRLTEQKSGQATEAIKETLALIRQIGTTRFVALPVFLGAAAALAKAHREPPWSDEAFLPWLGFGLASVGVIFEIVLSRNLICWWEALEPELKVRPWSIIYAHRSKLALWPVRLALFAPYAATIWYWSNFVFSPPWPWVAMGMSFVLAGMTWRFAKTTLPR